MMTMTTVKSPVDPAEKIRAYFNTSMPEGQRNSHLLPCASMALEGGMTVEGLFDLLDDLVGQRGDATSFTWDEVKRAYDRAADEAIDGAGVRTVVSRQKPAVGVVHDIGGLFAVYRDTDLGTWLRALYGNQDLIHIGSAREGRSALATRTVAEWCNVVETGGRPTGPYFCINPLRTSAAGRNEGNVARRDYLMLESDSEGCAPRPASEILLDSTDPRYAQLVVLRQLIAANIPIVSVVYSGEKSFHALVRIDGDKWPYRTSTEATRFKRALAQAGFDTATTDAPRLSRLPFAIRQETGMTQSLVFLDPSGASEPVRIDRLTSAIEAISGTTPDTHEEKHAPEANATTQAPAMDISTLREVLGNYGIVPWYDERQHTVHFEGLTAIGLSEDDSSLLIANTIEMLYRRYYGGRNVTQTNRVIEILTCLAEKDRRNPYLSLFKEEWDGVSRIKAAADWLHPKAPERIYVNVVKIWLKQTCMIAHNKGEYRTPYILAMVGPTGCGKTTWCVNLLPGDVKWFHQGGINRSEKDVNIANAEHLVVELSEVGDTTSKRSHNEIKAYVDQACDIIRRPYDSRSIRSPRRTSFVATGNDLDFLTDTTGNRRWLILDVEGSKIGSSPDKAHLDGMTAWFNANRTQLWAEVYHLWQTEDKGGQVLADPCIADAAAERAIVAVRPIQYEMEIMDLYDYLAPIDKWVRKKVREVAYDLYGESKASVQAYKISQALRVLCDRFQDKVGGKAMYSVTKASSWYLVPPLMASGAVNATPTPPPTAMQSSWPTDTQAHQ